MKAELKLGSVNQIIKDTDIYEAGDSLDSIAMVVKGRVRVHGYGISHLVGSGSFLGLRDLGHGAHGVTYTAQTNAVIYVFSVSGSLGDVKRIVQAKRDYGALMVAGLSRSLVEQEKAYEELQDAAEESYRMVSRAYQGCLDIAKETGADFEKLPAMERLYPFDEPQILALEKIRYYQACARVPMEVQKSFYGASEEICIYPVKEQISLLHQLHDYSRALTEYLEQLMKSLVLDHRSLYGAMAGVVSTLQRADQDASGAMAILDQVIDRINRLETLLQERADVTVEIDRNVMEEIYFKLLNPGNAGGSSVEAMGDTLALVEDSTPDASELENTLDHILSFAGVDGETAGRFVNLIHQFENMSDKESTSDEARSLRRSILKEYYPIYKQVFLRDYQSEESSPIEVELFLRYGFLSERLLREDLINELLTLDTVGGNQGGSRVYDMKEWLQAIYRGEREPSKNEFDMDYEEYLRDKRKNKEITEQEQKVLQTDQMKKLDFEIQNMFRVNHRLVNGQISIFVPFLYTEGCGASLERSFLSKEKVCAAVNRLRRIDFSAFYRESMYNKQMPGVSKEFIQEEVCPDVIVMPTIGSKDIMWQELSGRKRNTPGRFLLPVFLEGDLDKHITHLTGSFRWELCRTMQGAYWNNIQYKSLTSEYSDFLQFYRKNKELSDERKEKLKLQIQKNRNNSREVFASDYMNWIQHESQGGMVLSKPVREILATYCPFAAELRLNLEGQPVFQTAMARFQRERSKKCREYDLKFRIWQKDQVEVPPEIVATRDFYQEL